MSSKSPTEAGFVINTVYVTGPIDDDALDALRERREVVCGYFPEAPTLVDMAEYVDAIVVRTQTIDAAILRKARRCRIISRRGVGVDNIDLDVATALGIPVTITATANAKTVAEHVFALALGLLHNIIEGDRATRAGDFGARDRLLGRDLFSQRLGVIGVGRIGQEVIRIARQGFDMPVLAYDRFFPPNAAGDTGIKVVADLNQLLERSDIVTVHTPLTRTTRGLLGARELRRMKRGALLIHTARGGVIDEGALVEALQDGHLAGAGIDVYACEPPPIGHPLFALNNVIATPHSAGLSTQAVRRMSWAAARAVLDVLDCAPGVDPFAQNDWKIVNPQYVKHSRVVGR